jgi:hypothetical protein
VDQNPHQFQLASFKNKEGGIDAKLKEMLYGFLWVYISVMKADDENRTRAFVLAWSYLQIDQSGAGSTLYRNLCSELQNQLGAKPKITIGPLAHRSHTKSFAKLFRVKKIGEKEILLQLALATHNERDRIGVFAEHFLDWYKRKGEVSQLLDQLSEKSALPNEKRWREFFKRTP